MGTCGVFMHDMVSHNAVTICSELQNTVLIHLKCLANRRSITLLFFFFVFFVAMLSGFTKSRIALL